MKPDARPKRAQTSFACPCDAPDPTGNSKLGTQANSFPRKPTIVASARLEALSSNAQKTLLSSPIFGTRKCCKSGAVQLGLPRCCWLQKTQAQNTHAIAHMLDTVRCSLCSSARPQCRWMPSFRQRWHARIGKLHVCKHLSLKSKSRKGCQNVLCRIC
jgi:hypothetical protein